MVSQDVNEKRLQDTIKQAENDLKNKTEAFDQLDSDHATLLINFNKMKEQFDLN